MPRVTVPEYSTFVDFPDGTPPEEMQSALAAQFPKKHGVIDNVIKGPAARVAQGINESLGSALSAFGLSKGAEAYRQGAEYWKRKAEESGSSGIPAQIYTGLGSAPMGVTEFVAGPVYAGAKGAASGYQTGGVPGAVQGAATEALKRFAVGKVFKGIENANLSPLQRTGAMAGTMGAQTAAEGGTLPDVVAATATGALLMPPTGGGRSSVVRQRMQAAGAAPEVAADLAGRGAADAIPAGMGDINTNNVDTVYSADTAPPPAIRDSEQIALTGNESRQPITRGPVLDAENASRISPYDATGPSPGLSIEVARLKQEHPYWSDAEYLKEARKTVLTQNPETLPAATDMSTVRPAEPQAVRPAEDAPGLRRGVPIGDQEMGQRLGTTDRITEPTAEQVLNPEVLPARTERDVYAGELGLTERPGENAPSRAVEPPSMESGAATEPLTQPVEQPAKSVTSEFIGSGSMTPDGKAQIELAKNEVSKGNYDKVVTPKGLEIGLVHLDDGDAGGQRQILAFDRDGKLVGDLVYTAGAMEDGRGFNPSIEVDPSYRRNGVATELYRSAESRGGVIPDLNQRGQVRSPEGQAFREAIAPAGQKGGEANGQEKGRQGLLNESPVVGTVDLHAGVHIPTLVKQGKDLFNHYFQKLDPSAPSGSLKAEFDKNRIANEKFGQEPLVNKLKRALIDSSANVQEALMRQGSAGEFVRRQFDAISGSSAKAQLAVEKQREALAGMSLREQQAMGDLIAIDRDLAINKPGYTKIFGKTDAELRAARANFQAEYKLSDPEMARIEAATRSYFDAWKQNTQRMLDAGLIDATQKAALDAQDYSPKQFLEKIDPDTQAFSSIGGGRVTVPDSGIKRLKEGSDTYFRNNPMRLLSEATARIETRIARNEANQALATLPAGNGIAEVVKPGTPAPSGYETITYMENGKPQTIHMKSEYAKEWRQNDPLINSELVGWLQWLTGAKIVRAGATGYNPAFLVTNVPRDLVTLWLQADKKGYSAHAPVAVAEMAKDLSTVAKDAWSRTGRYKDYVMQGGGRELLTHEGALSSRRENLAPAVAKVQKVLSYVNEFSEIVTRLAYRERLIKNGMDPASASKAAGEYVDFSRGGSVAKAVDRLGVPYLNAALQGTRSIARAAGRDPGAFAYKTAQLMAGAAGIYALNQAVNPQGWANVSDREKADNFIIMLPKAFEYTDKDGTLVSPYLKISKEQSMRPFATVAELFTHWANGGKPTKQQLEMAVGAALPISLDKLPPTAAAFWTYALNADTYKKEPVWKGKQEIEPYAEYTNNTNPVYTAIGKATASPDEQGVMRGGISPERLKAGVEKIVPPSNAYLQGMGNMLTDAFEKMNPSDKVKFEKTNYEQLRSVPGISRLMGGAKDTEQFREGIREARTGTATQQFETNKTLDAMVLRYVKTGRSDADLYDRITAYVEKQPESVRTRLENRISDLVDTADLPDRGWWLSVKALQPEDRADQFKARLNKLDAAEQARMIETANNLKGFVSDRFMERYNAAP